MLETALQPFLQDPQCAGGSLLLAADDPHRGRLTAALPSHISIDEGGAERAHSVCNGLRALEPRAAADDWVLVHDAARPALSAGDLQRLLQYGGQDAVGALLAAPVADTVKRAQEGSPPQGSGASGVRRCGATLPREALWLAQTPQMFRYAPLRAALERAVADGRTPTDEAQAMEWQGHAALLVPARDSNIKITTATDLLLAQAILRQRGV